MFAPVDRQEKQKFFADLPTDEFEDDATHFIVSAIEKETELVRNHLRAAENPGKIWKTWKVNIKAQLQGVQKMLRRQDLQNVEAARVVLDQAAERYRVSSNRDNSELFDEAMRNYKETVLRSSQYSQGNAFDFQATNSESSSKHFFRPLDASLRRVSIEEVVTPNGDVLMNPQEISLRFIEHWGSEMGDANSPTGMAHPPDDGKQRQLLDLVLRFVTASDREMLDAELTTADLACATRHMKATSSPGMDGLTAGFYQVVPYVFGDRL
ncbi:uncharacterized protein PHALS_08035 [Plasmopara halstedii]|uniref:Uncharacterized protein n=1 Tax=Plasmopara halstedii TaxID=4781 RepID=A0A0P1B8I5_PLAHL|nr:uncharacterized protein PHALS_08035 [Plasmopara halstedii]CEG50316.1 hypothetical protein PHALS_08035 [Plasmopara halstedii]|eukprot:XP_024586685.1 hypothetical protein PHALS_08035 [Plasmopara halstedii]